MEPQEMFTADQVRIISECSSQWLQRQTHKVMTQTLYRVTIKKLLMFKGVSFSHFAPVLSIILSRSNTGWMGNSPSVSHVNSV